MRANIHGQVGRWLGGLADGVSAYERRSPRGPTTISEMLPIKFAGYNGRSLLQGLNRKTDRNA